MRLTIPIILLFLSFDLANAQNDSLYSRDTTDSGRGIIDTGPKSNDSMDAKGVEIKIKGSRSNENIIIIDGVVTENPINDSSRSIVPDSLMKDIQILVGDFEAEYGFNIHEYRITYDWFISHSIGFAPDESMPAFFVNVATKVSTRLYLGLRAGIYTYENSLDSVVNDTIRAHAPYLAGNYIFKTDFVTQGPSYITAIFGSYSISKNFYLQGSAGLRFYSEDTWSGEFGFSSPANNYYPPPVLVTPNLNFSITSSETKLKPYFSLGVDYKSDRFLVGVYGDNLFSFGINLGIGFN